MIETTRRRRWSRRLAPLALVLLVAGLLPTLPAQAVGIIDQSLDNAQAEFVRGTFLGTAVSPETSSIVPNDQGGTVQLTPLGLLNPWPRRGDLPEGIASHGVATIGDRLYSVAGVVRDGATNAVYWAKIDRATGAPRAHDLPANDPRIVSSFWANDPLPAAQGSVYTNCTDASGLTTRVNPAVASYDRGDGSGYLYVIGGNAGLANCSANVPPPVVAEPLSVPTVQIGTVAADGEITWTGGAEVSSYFLPSPPLAEDDGTTVGTTRVGIQSSQALVARAGSGKLFLYVLGGSGVFPVSADVDRARRAFTTPAVFYTEIIPTSGRFRNPLTGSTSEPWTRTLNIPVRRPTGQTDGTYGIFEHTASVGRAVTGTGVNSVVRDAIFVAGGYISLQGAQDDLPRDTLNPYVYMATIDADTGALTWNDKPTRANVDVATEGGSVASLGSIAYNNKLYLIAGTPNDSNASSFNSVIAGGYDGSFLFQPLLSEQEFFVGRQQESNPVLASGLVETSAGVMTAEIPQNAANANAAWAFAVGGETRDGTLSDGIFVGSIGGINEASATVRARDGWYYSQFYDISIAREGSANSSARVLSIRWATEIDRTEAGNPNADVIVEFRRVLRPDLLCDASVFPDSVPWLRLDGDTASPAFYSAPATAARPQNEVTLRDVFGTEDFNATCFQYRARLTQNGLTDGGVPNSPNTRSATPKLLSVSIQKVLPGTPDLRVVEQSDFQVSVIDGRFANLALKVTNLNLEGLNNTQSADALAGGQTHALLCVSYSATGEPPDPAFPTLPMADGSRAECAPVYGLLNRSALGAGQSVTFSRTSEWLRNSDPNIDSVYGDIGNLFATPGFYKVGVVLDPLNEIEEGAAGEANNMAEFNGVKLIRAFQITDTPLPPPPPGPDPDNPKVYLPFVRR